jgi:hypothetical protein
LVYNLPIHVYLDLLNGQTRGGFSPMPPEETSDALAKQILKYFLRNPQAADTLEGVAHWRLLDERVHQRVEDISQTLQWLVAKGYLKETTRVGSRTMFQLEQENHINAQKFIEGESRFTARG